MFLPKIARQLSKFSIEGQKQIIHLQKRGGRTLVTRRMREMYARSKDFKALNIPLLPRSQYLEWNYSAELFAFSRRLHENISEGNLKIAFTHQSYVDKEMKRRQQDLTLDAVALDGMSSARFASQGRELISSFSKKYLRYYLPKLPEEGIVALHDFLLDTESMAFMSKSLGTRDLIISGDDFPSDDALADTLAAIVGVLAEEKGLPHVHKFIIDFIMTYLQDKQIFEIWDLEEPKSVLNTILRNEGSPAYEARLLHQVGVSTILPSYSVGLYVNKQLFGQAICSTVDEAETMAAFNALAIKFEILPSSYVFRFGPHAYDVDYERYDRENQSIANWHDVKGKFTQNIRLDG